MGCAAAVRLYRGEVQIRSGRWRPQSLGRRRLAGVDAPADAGAVPQLRNPAGTEVMGLFRGDQEPQDGTLAGSIALTCFAGIIAKYCF